MAVFPRLSAGRMARSPAARPARRGRLHWSTLCPPPLRGPGRRAAVLRRRVARSASLLLIGLATLLVVHHVLAAVRPVTTPLLVAARDLAPGERITEGDVELRELPPAAGTDASLDDPAQATGRVVIGAVGAGEVLTPGRFAGSGVARTKPPADQVALHIALPDETSLTWLQAGDRVDLIAVDSGTTVASTVLVLAIDPAGDPGAFGVDAAGGGRGVLAAVPAGQAAAVARAARSPGGIAAAARSPSP